MNPGATRAVRGPAPRPLTPAARTLACTAAVASLMAIGCSWRPLAREASIAAGGDSTAPSRRVGEPSERRRVTVEIHAAFAAAAEGREPHSLAGRTLFVDPVAALSRRDIAEVRTYEGEGGHLVELIFTFEGRERFAILTREQTGEYVAFLIDGKLRSAPKVAGPVDDGRAFISGVSRDEAEALAASLTP